MVENFNIEDYKKIEVAAPIISEEKIEEQSADNKVDESQENKVKE